MKMKLSHEEYKKLYKSKIEAIEFLRQLKTQYPELFEQSLLIKMLKDEYNSNNVETPIEIERLLNRLCSLQSKH